MTCTSLSYSSTDFAAAVCFVRGMRSDDVCPTVALGVVMYSFFDPLLLCASHGRLHRRDNWHEGAAAVVLLLYCIILFF